jgi:hypothetical protein
MWKSALDDREFRSTCFVRLKVQVARERAHGFWWNSMHRRIWRKGTRAPQDSGFSTASSIAIV